MHSNDQTAPAKHGGQVALIGILRERHSCFAVLGTPDRGQRLVPIMRPALRTLQAFRNAIREECGYWVVSDAEAAPTPALQRLHWRELVRSALLRGLGREGAAA